MVHLCWDLCFSEAGKTSPQQGMCSVLHFNIVFLLIFHGEHCAILSNSTWAMQSVIERNYIFNPSLNLHVFERLEAHKTQCTPHSWFSAICIALSCYCLMVGVGLGLLPHGWADSLPHPSAPTWSRSNAGVGTVVQFWRAPTSHNIKRLFAGVQRL